MTTSAKRPPRSWERRILHREILKYGGSMLLEPELYRDDGNGSMLLGCSYTTPQLAADATLTGFAQLAALRMNCKHGFISLIDDKYQHVLAESTRTTSPYDVAVHGPADDLLVGVKTLDIEFGICPLTLAAFGKGADTMIDTEITYADESRYVISDLFREPRVSKTRFMESNTTSRFYADVPLRNSEGMVIGSLSVIDIEPRSQPAAIDVRALQDIALMTMDHFDLINIREISLRAERLMQGLGHFNSGKSSISQWIMDHPDRALARDGDDYYVQTPAMLAMSEAQLDHLTPGEDTTRADRASSTVSPAAHMKEYFDLPSGNSESQTPHEADAVGRGLPTGHRLLDVQGELTPQPITPEVRQPLAGLPKPSRAKPVEFVQSRLSADIHDAFSRASNLIRQSMDLDATCFLEISPEARFHINGRNATSRSGSRSSTSPSTAKTHGYRTESVATKARATKTKTETAEINKGRLCSRLGLSTRLKSGGSKDGFRPEFATFPELALSKLAAEFPGGNIFTFDQFGALSTGDKPRTVKSSKSARRRLANLMVNHFPDARSLIFMPLYDNEKQHLYAGFFGWTTNSKRVLLENESVYVLGFANSIMCEVMRLETLAVEKAKSDFMSSMSHELRSPLHGILGATQLMQESEMPAAQRELAMMIDSCGRTLLDIMNNLLEHAKINNVANNAGGGRKGSKASIEDTDKDAAGVDNQLESVDLATLVEETVTSVAAGHAVREQRSEQVSIRRRTSALSVGNGSPGPNDLGTGGIPLPPTVVIDIPHRHNWVFETEAGSWRRIVMNLVGNALKYTQRGHIHVSLFVDEGDRFDQEASNFNVTLTVTDTGQGISDSYLKHRLFTPFAQENSMSVGAGLGLSIVNRLVEALNGDIRMESELDVGTKVTVVVPLPPDTPDHASLVRSNSVSTVDNVRLMSSGNEVVTFVGFGDAPVSNGMADIKNHSARSRSSTLQKLKESLSELSTTWLGLSVTDDLEQATILVVEESCAKALLRKDPSDPVFEKKFVAVNAFDHANQHQEQWPGRCAFLSSPIGPVKFARVLSAVLQSRGETASPQPLPGKRRISADNDSRTENHFGSASTLADSQQPVLKRPRLSSVVSKATMSDVITMAEHPTRAPNDQCRVLLVEDNMINLKLLASFMRKLELPYTTATNGQEALDEYIAANEANEPFQYVFMDITMPVMDGLTSTRRIRAYEKANHIAPATEIAALTGLGHVEAQEEALSSGVDRYFCKPVKLDSIKALLIDKKGG